MDFFDKLGKKATEAYKVTADKTGKIAKDTKIKLKMSELKSQINDIYEEIGKLVYEKHTSDEEISGVEEKIEENCTKIDEICEQIDNLLKESMQLRDKRQCPKCYAEIEKESKYCPNCGEKQEEIKETEVVQEVPEEAKVVEEETEVQDN